jgi:hypothetical protein
MIQIGNVELKINMSPRHIYVIALVLLVMPLVAQAQFIFTTNNGAITITGYNGPGGTVVVPETIDGYTVTGIGEEAFANCTNITSIAVTNSVMTIGADAFFGCTGLVGIVLSNNVTSIGEAAFYGCASLTNFTVPVSVTNIGAEALADCSSLTNISVAVGNPSFSSVYGILLDKGATTIIQYPIGQTNASYTIPTSIVSGNHFITSIAPYAFAYCTNLTTVAIPWFGNLNNIGDFAFTGCTRLTSVTNANVEEYLTLGVTNVGVGAFSFCTSLDSIIIGITNSATTIEGLAFAFCTNLTIIDVIGNAPPDLGTIFYDDPDAIVRYEMGATGWGATFGGAPTVEESPSSDFYYQTYNGSVTITDYRGPGGLVIIPKYINDYPVTMIGEGLNGAFPNGVTSVIIPNRGCFLIRRKCLWRCK